METLQNTGAVRPPKAANKKNTNQESSASGYDIFYACSFIRFFFSSKFLLFQGKCTGKIARDQGRYQNRQRVRVPSSHRLERENRIFA